MEIRAFPAAAVIDRLGRLRADLRPLDDVDGLHRQRRQPHVSGRGQIWQCRVHPGSSHGDSRRRQVAADERKRPRRRGPGVGAAPAARQPHAAARFPRSERYYFLEERYPKYGNLVPRDIATREIFNVCTRRGAERREGSAVRVSRSDAYPPGRRCDQKLGGILEIYEKFQGVDPREVPMKIFPAVHYSMGGLWVDYEATADGRLVIGSIRNQQTNIPGLYAIGECDYQYHGANRLGANSLLSCIFSGLIVRPQRANAASKRRKAAGRRRPRSSKAPGPEHQAFHDRLLRRHGRRRESVSDPPGAGPGDDQARPPWCGTTTQLSRGLWAQCSELAVRAGRCSLSDTGHWTNQNVVFTKALLDMFPLAKAISERCLSPRRMPRGPLQARIRHAGRRATDPAERRRAGRSLVRPFRGKHAANGSNRPSPIWIARWRAEIDLRRRQYVADSATAAAVWPGRGRSDRRSLERGGSAARPPAPPAETTRPAAGNSGRRPVKTAGSKAGAIR